MIEIPARVPWELHRIATSERYHDSLAEIANEWGLDDVWDAHDVLDAFDAAEG